MITHAVETMVDALHSSSESMLISLGVDRGEIKRIQRAYGKELMDHVQAQFKDPEAWRERMHRHARDQYTPIEEFEEEVNHQVAHMRSHPKMSEGIAASHRRVCERLSEFVRANDRIVKRVVHIAETEGVERATQKGTVNGVVREMFPTSGEYRAFAQRGLEATRKYHQEREKITRMQEKELLRDHMFGPLVTIAEQLRLKSKEICEEMYREHVEKTIEEMYA